MKIKKSKFEKLLSECVQEVLSDMSRQPKKPNSKKMNETQFNAYLENIINEELVKEGMWDYVKGVGQKVGGDIANSARQAGRSIHNKVSNLGNTMRNGANAVRDYANSARQAGANRSAAADAQKLAQEVDALYQKCGQNLTKGQKSSIRGAKSALKKLSMAFESGDVNA